MRVAKGLFLFGTAANLARSRIIPVTGLMTGIDSQTGAVPVRRNINDLEAEGGPTWYANLQVSGRLHLSSVIGTFSFLLFQHSRISLPQKIIHIMESQVSTGNTSFSICVKSNLAQAFMASRMRLGMASKQYRVASKPGSALTV